MRSLATSLLVVLLPTAALAERWDGDCSQQATAATSATVNVGSHTIDSRNDLACFTFVEGAADDTTSENSPAFSVTAEAALVCFDSDIAAAGAGLATADIRNCPHGAMPAANPTFQCSLSTALSESTCLTIDPGVYYIDITAIGGAGTGDHARVTIRGLGSGD